MPLLKPEHVVGPRVQSLELSIASCPPVSLPVRNMLKQARSLDTIHLLQLFVYCLRLARPAMAERHYQPEYIVPAGIRGTLLRQERSEYVQLPLPYTPSFASGLWHM